MSYSYLFIILAVLLAGCSKSENTSEKHDATDQHSVYYGSSITRDLLNNPVAYIPPQCYTDPVSIDGNQEKHIQNPCYVCHTPSKRPNYLNDNDVQLEYFFPERGLKNEWSNIFKDRTAEIEKIDSDWILNYVREDNYLSKNKVPSLSEKLKNVPKEWDRNGNGRWDGYIPDAQFNFDSEGFDIDQNGQDTGWRVYAYYPFPGTFMPTNGSTDDVMVRLPEEFRQNEAGQLDRTVYRINLAIVEALMKEEDIAISLIDEVQLGVDLNKDGELNRAEFVRYDWAPKEGRLMSYVGKAKLLQENGDVHLAARLLPEGTEFLHSVRYLDIRNGKVAMAKRMKELRYSKKLSWRNYHQLRTIVDQEIKERHDFPDRTKIIMGNMETGMTTAQGWVYQGFIEDVQGDLRPQSYEETAFCVGCHGYIGASNDTTLSFTRKFDHTSFRSGWYHWSEQGLEGVADPIREDGDGEYAYYLKNNPTGNEYRTNDEVFNRFHHADGQRKDAMFERLANDISVLLMPTPERAMELNKAYRVIVAEQSYDKGREPVIKPLTNVKRSVKLSEPTGIKTPLSHY